MNQSRHQVNHPSRAKKLNQEKTILASHQDTLLMPAAAAASNAVATNASTHSYNPFPVTKKLLEANSSISKSSKMHQQPMYDFVTSEDISGYDTNPAAHQQQQQQLVHIIQHPSWRINIKQQQQQSQQGDQSESNGTSQQHYVPSNSSHLPFTYCRK